MPSVRQQKDKTRVIKADAARYRGGGMDERWRDLAASIIEQAVADYKNAISTCNTTRKIECVAFFTSDWFKVLSGGIDGRILLERLRRRYG